ncbi:MAG: XdhC family protein [Candidatus Poribacteria bacterium]|nr:XdhC family protein [Candidatus Poribacteria bacterium]
MREIHRKIPELIEAEEIGAYCTVVESKGSTPQKPGSKLLILPDLQNIGTLGGGCVEAEARRQAIGLMQGGIPRLLDFRLDSDYGWDDGLICGGNMKIFIDLPQSNDDAFMFTRLEDLIGEKVPHVFATVVKSEVNDIKAGMKMIAASNGDCIGSLGDSTLESAMQRESAEVLAENSPRIFRWNSGDVWVFMDPVQPRPTLLIAGAGHVGQALCHLGDWLDFDIVIVDDRPDFASKERLPEADQIVIGDIADELRKFPIDNMTYAVIVTRGHRHDEEALYSVVESDACYVGLIGSRRKIKLIYDDLLALGVSKERLARVYAPIGLDINSKTVPEIAVSIAAQLIQIRNNIRKDVRFDSQPARMPTVKVSDST